MTCIWSFGAAAGAVFDVVVVVELAGVPWPPVEQTVTVRPQAMTVTRIPLIERMC